MTRTRRVAYVHSGELIGAADCLPANEGRAWLVHSLVDAFSLVYDSDGSREGPARAQIIEPERASRADLLKFHDERYIDYVQLVAEASTTAARILRDGEADVAINWTGGRHHAKRGEASGFCYVNDIVLAIMELRSSPKPPPPSSSLDSSPQPSLPSRISRVLYLDIDLHHGDGVESAFFTSPYVLTLSVHLHAPLFFPSSGALDSTGPANPKAPSRGHALNVALEPGLGEANFKRVWDSCVEKVAKEYGADAVVVQVGVDGMVGDPCKEWNLPLSAYGYALERVLRWNKRTLVLGGGGYNSANAARAWAYLTSVALGRPLPLDSPIPSDLDAEFYAHFAPDFALDVPEGNMRDQNTEETLSKVEKAFEEYAGVLHERWAKKRELKQGVQS
uniref:histone deacetylase n=1 Tax=Rhodotorula toruloides TaxID=5286 RepID=A0A0K3CGL9_RHOTO